MPQMNGVVLSQELQNIDPTLLYRFITAANKEYIETLNTNSPDIENNIICKPLWLNELRTTIHSLLSNKEKQQKEDKDTKLLMMIV
jgi:two-component SAPR family response regulator